MPLPPNRIFIFVIAIITALLIVSLVLVLIIPLRTASVVYHSPSGSNTETISTLSSFSDPVSSIQNQEELETYIFNDPVEHIFFHPLLAYPKRAFDNDKESNGFDDWFVTVDEFKKVIESVYKNGYVLVDIESLYEEKDNNGTLETVRKPLYIPVEKKPLIISIDDLNYYDYMRKNGTSVKLILDSNGKIATLSKDDKNKDVISYDNEVIPILDKFIEKHPDFSLNGAKGVIALTGYEGVLGYRTAAAYKKHKAEQEAVAPIIEALKKNGWRFASHSYFHKHANSISLKALGQDADLWEKEVKSLIGPTDIYIYPFGERLQTGTPKFTYLKNKGFRIFIGVGPFAFDKFSDGTVFNLRRHVDGIAFRTQRTLNLPLYDADEVIDRTVRPVR